MELVSQSFSHSVIQSVSQSVSQLVSQSVSQLVMHIICPCRSPYKWQFNRLSMKEGTRLCMTFICCVHMLVYMNDYRRNARNE
jgi:hypothetical protein